MIYTNNLLNTLVNAFWILFGVSELALLIMKRSKRKEVKVRKDKNSMLMLWIVILAASFTAGYVARIFPIEGSTFLMKISGMGIMLLGFIVRWIAIIQLGSAFTVDVSVGKEHKMKVDGLYSNIRHPSYLGLLITFTGMSMLFGSYISIPIVIVPVFIGLAYRMYIEEQLLLEIFDEKYEYYMSHTARIIPFIY